MKYKINDQYEINSQDVTNLAFKLAKIVKDSSYGFAHFSGLKDMPSYVSKYYPELMNDRMNKLMETNSKINVILNNESLKGKHDIKFYIDDFYFVEFAGDTYILYVHSDLNGNPGKVTDSKPAPNKERRKVVGYPHNINHALEVYYYQILRNCQFENDEFLAKIDSLIVELTSKANSIIEQITASKAA